MSDIYFSYCYPIAILVLYFVYSFPCPSMEIIPLFFCYWLCHCSISHSPLILSVSLSHLSISCFLSFFFSFFFLSLPSFSYFYFYNHLYKLHILYTDSYSRMSLFMQKNKLEIYTFLLYFLLNCAQNINISVADSTNWVTNTYTILINECTNQLL